MKEPKTLPAGTKFNVLETTLNGGEKFYTLNASNEASGGQINVKKLGTYKNLEDLKEEISEHRSRIITKLRVVPLSEVFELEVYEGGAQ